jgi:nucleoid-associated protein YgaU
VAGSEIRNVNVILPLLLASVVGTAVVVVAVVRSPVSELPAEATATPSDVSAGPAPVADEAPAAPAFDLVRVEPSGAAIVAGSAAPGARVTIYLDKQPLAQATADEDGNFVAMFTAEPSTAPRTMSLEAEGPAGLSTSPEVVMLFPKSGASADDAAAPVSSSGAAPVASAPPPEVAATAIVRQDSVDVVAPAAGDGALALASISYAAAGEVTLAGAGTAGAVLRVYVDGRLAEEAQIGEDGRWTLTLAAVESGLYRLRIDQLAPDGSVDTRVETPFQRDMPPLPRPGAAIAVPGAGVVTVQPGHNLWTLAREHYGSGVRYTQIFTANRELIGNPDLIYPGQILALPDAAE